MRGGRVGASVGTVLDASGAQGGGLVEMEASNPAGPAALFVGADSIIRADALQNGNGGRRVLLVSRPFPSDDLAPPIVRRAPMARSVRMADQRRERRHRRDFGSVSRRERHPRVARAPQGTAGQWLIDPIDVTISNGASTGVSGPPNFTAAAPGANLQNTDIQNCSQQRDQRQRYHGPRYRRSGQRHGQNPSTVIEKTVPRAAP